MRRFKTAMQGSVFPDITLIKRDTYMLQSRSVNVDIPSKECLNVCQKNWFAVVCRLLIMAPKSSGPLQVEVTFLGFSGC